MTPLESAKAERDVLLKTKVEIERKLDAIEQSIEILSPVYEPQPAWKKDLVTALSAGQEAIDRAKNYGLTDAIERSMSGYPAEVFSPTGIRDLVVRDGFTISAPNPMAVVHQALKRMASKPGPIRSFAKNGRVGYFYEPNWVASRSS
ncbi:MAG: hypothetical protein ABI811_20880 [Acidobacteriota bacterium]